MGVLFGVQRRLTGGIQAPILTHVTWSALMLRFLPPLFADRPASATSAPSGQGGDRRRTPGSAASMMWTPGRGHDLQMVFATQRILSRADASP
jgi:hypothetical protein